jgi:hypothetical protein
MKTSVLFEGFLFIIEVNEGADGQFVLGLNKVRQFRVRAKLARFF